jgi:hypothetical protein
LYLKRCIEARIVPETPLFYGVVAVVTAFAVDMETIALGIGVIVGLSIAARYWVSVRLLSGWPATAIPSARWLVALAGITFVFCLPIPGERWMLPQIPPNLWHNSTSIFVMPFVVLLFARTMDHAGRGGWQSVGAMTLLVTLNILAKPSFFLCFVLALPLFLVLNARPIRAYLPALVPLGAGLALLGAQYLYIYRTPGYQAFLDDRSTHLALGWFHVWSQYVNGEPALVIPIAIVNALLLPIALAVVYPGRFFSDQALRFCLLLLGASLAIYALIHETGMRLLHGNFGWGPTMCNYLLHVCALGLFMRIKGEQPRWTRGDQVLAVLFVAEVLVGIAYLVRFVFTGRGAA